MKKAFIDCMVTRKQGTEFDDGSKIVQISLEDGFSFNVAPGSILDKKVGEGCSIDLTYSDETPRPYTTRSGQEFIFKTLNGVKVLAIRPSTAAVEFADLPDAGETTSFRQVSSAGGKTPAAGGEIGKV